LSCKIGFLNKIKDRKGISLNINKKKLEKKPPKKSINLKKQKKKQRLSATGPIKQSEPTDPIFSMPARLSPFFFVAVRRTT
jgi:hypothetical protein